MFCHGRSSLALPQETVAATSPTSLRAGAAQLQLPNASAIANCVASPCVLTATLYAMSDPALAQSLAHASAGGVGARYVAPKAISLYHVCCSCWQSKGRYFNLARQRLKSH